MRTIYEKASEVAIWLGSEALHSDLVFAFLHAVLPRADAEAELHELLTDSDSTTYLYALPALFLRPYWDQIWVIQEVLSARRKNGIL